MTDDIVMRAARAMAEDNGFCWENCAQSQWKRDVAVVMTVMREPDEATVEKVARAIWDASFDRMPDPPWDETTALQKRFHHMLAREAIKATIDAATSQGA